MIGNDLYQKITDRILQDMERGVMPWSRKWKSKQRDAVAGMPSNAYTGKAYRGINVILLWLAADEMQSDDMRFATFKQVNDAGGKVIKGSKSFQIYFFSVFEKEDKNNPDKLVKIPMLKYFNVYHISQTENCKWKTVAVDGKAAKPEMPEDTVEFIKLLGARVNHGLGRYPTPCYVPASDTVHMPFPDEFAALQNYRETLYHELMHWTGHASRLQRDFSGHFGNKAYAKEELIAELGAAFICAEFGLEYSTRHASYLNSWLEVLRHDNKAFMQAASAAQKAVDYVRETVLGKPIDIKEAA